jgi:phage terminase large subunit-like protein
MGTMGMIGFDVAGYCNKVIANEDGRNGRLYILACKRFLEDMNNPEYYYDERQTERCIKFISLLKHFTGKFNQEQFILADFQKFIVANIFGLYKVKTHTRKFTSSYIQIARKNGKSAFAAALALYALIADGEPNAEVVIAANSVEQGKVCFNMCLSFAEQLDNKMFKKYRSSIEVKKTNSVLKVISTNYSAADGGNTSFAVIDEFHSNTDGLIRSTIQSSMGMRTQPHLCTITTAGFDKSLPCYELRNLSADILQGVKKDEQHFCCIFEMDEEDNWRFEEHWYKCTPNLGVTVNLEWLRNQVDKAINNPSDEAGVRVKNLNQWLNSNNTWIQDTSIIKCFEDEGNVLKMFNLSNFYYVSVDLSATTDLTCASFLTEYKNKLYAHTVYFIPEDAVETNRLKTKMQEWHRNGELIFTPGNVCDYDYVLNFIKKFDKDVKSRVKKIYLDRWNATQFQISLVENGLPVEPYSQALASFNGPTKFLEKSILSENIVLSRSSLTLECFRNVELKSDWNGNIKPYKSGDNRSKKIDGTITLIMCCAAYASDLKYSNSII